MFKQTYQSMNAQIRPDDRLLQDTKDRMCSISVRAPEPRRRTALGAAAVCVILATAVFVIPKPPQTALQAKVSVSGSSSTAPSSAASEIKTPLPDKKYVSVVKLNDGVLNFMDSSTPQANRKLYFDPKTTHEEQWTPEKTVQYLGKDVRPVYLPEILAKTRTEADNAVQFVVMNNDGTAAYDNINYYYTSGTDAVTGVPSLSVKVSKGKLPLECVLYRSENQKESTIKGNKLLVGHEVMQTASGNVSGASAQAYDLYYAEFLYQGIGYRVVSNYLPQQEFVKVLVSLFR